MVALCLSASLLGASGDFDALAQMCEEDYQVCVENCDVQHGLEPGKAKLRKCTQRCFENREECLDRLRD